MSDVIKFGKFKNFEKNKNKKQIILCNSFRSSEKYLNSLKYRNNGDYKKVPNYFIDISGKIISLLPDDSVSNFFNDYEVNRNSIIICLENNGWLNKTPFNLGYINWIGDIYNGKVFERKWRDKIYWQTYTEEQVNSLVDICKKVTKKFSISRRFIGHNTKVDGVKIFNGIVCRSNYDNRYTDVNPSFDFEEFKKRIENE
jgi:N-acetyl-anhydromuramyl-L-alanine amidase AmpD